jgi:DNA end-binding protein Ku
MKREWSSDRDNRVKGYEVAKGDYVIVSDEELAAIETESTHTKALTRSI